MEANIHHQKLKEKARVIFAANPTVYCTYFETHITFNSDGFHHLQFSNRRERNKNEQNLKFSLLPLAVKIIKKSGTVQEYRTGLCEDGKRGRDGFMKTKNIEYWGLEAIAGDNKIKVRTILRRIGDGKIIFWSVMPTIKLNVDRFEMLRSLAKKGIEDD
jgi:hypothetical protein